MLAKLLIETHRQASRQPSLQIRRLIQDPRILANALDPSRFHLHHEASPTHVMAVMPVHLVRRMESQAKWLRGQRCLAIYFRIGPLENDIERGLFVSVWRNLEVGWVDHLFEGEPGDR